MPAISLLLNYVCNFPQIWRLRKSCTNWINKQQVFCYIMKMISEYRDLSSNMRVRGNDNGVLGKTMMCKPGLQEKWDHKNMDAYGVPITENTFFYIKYLWSVLKQQYLSRWYFQLSQQLGEYPPTFKHTHLKFWALSNFFL